MGCKPRIMVMSLGGSPEPLKKSIVEYGPEIIVFFASQESALLAKDVLSAAAPKPKHFLEITEDPNLLFECYKTARSCVDRIGRLGALPHEVMIDYTGGTKVMSAALLLATAGNRFLFNYVGGDQRNKDNLGTVVDGKEKMFSEMSPWSIFAEEERRQAAALFNRRMYAAVISIVDSCTDKPQCPAKIGDYFRFVRSLSEGFLFWEQFNHGASLRKINAGIRELEAYCKRYSDSSFEPFAQAVEKLKLFLSDLVDKTSDDRKKFDMIMVYDLVSNARRRMLDERFDDAAARIYRALELYGQICFTEMTHCSNGKVEPELIPESLRDEFIRKYAEPEQHILKLPLEATFRFLKEKGHEAGIRYFDEAVHKKIKIIQYNRNNSILAHGLKPVEKHEMKSMFDTICDFLKITTFIDFPELQ